MSISSTAIGAAGSESDLIYITRWSDPLIDRLGHDPRSRYVEQFWLGILGPSTVWLLRYCATALDAMPEGTVLDLGETARTLGLGHKGGRNSPMARSIVRACRFGAARPAAGNQLEVRRRLAPLNRAQVQRLPAALQHQHEAAMDDTTDTDPEILRDRARRLALGLVECGDPLDGAEIQLGRWRFPPSVAAEAVRWAWDTHHRGAQTGPDAA